MRSADLAERSLHPCACSARKRHTWRRTWLTHPCGLKGSEGGALLSPPACAVWPVSGRARPVPGLGVKQGDSTEQMTPCSMRLLFFKARNLPCNGSCWWARHSAPRTSGPRPLVKYLPVDFMRYMQEAAINCCCLTNGSHSTTAAHTCNCARIGWCPTTSFHRALDLASRPSSSSSCASQDCSSMPPAWPQHESLHVMPLTCACHVLGSHLR